MRMASKSAAERMKQYHQRMLEDEMKVINREQQKNSRSKWTGKRLKDKQLGGIVKRTVWRRIPQRCAIVNLAKEFAVIAKESCPNVNSLFISKDDVAELPAKLDNKWSKCMPTQIPQTQAQHYVRAKNLKN